MAYVQAQAKGHYDRPLAVSKLPGHQQIVVGGYFIKKKGVAAMFFTKSRRYQRRLRKAITLVNRITQLTAPYLYEKSYQPSVEEAQLLEALGSTCQRQGAYLMHVLKLGESASKGFLSNKYSHKS